MTNERADDNPRRQSFDEFRRAVVQPSESIPPEASYEQPHHFVTEPSTPEEPREQTPPTVGRGSSSSHDGVAALRRTWSVLAPALKRTWFILVPLFFLLTQGIGAMIVVAFVCVPIGYWQWLRRLPPDRRESRQQIHSRLLRRFRGGIGWIMVSIFGWLIDANGSRAAQRDAAYLKRQRQVQANRDHEWDKLRDDWAAEAKARKRGRGGLF